MFRGFHEDSKMQALKWFDEKPKFGGEPLIAQQRINIETLIDQHLRYFEGKNDCEKVNTDATHKN